VHEQAQRIATMMLAVMLLSKVFIMCTNKHSALQQ